MTATTEAPRERVLRAAERQFRRYGYRRTTVDDITREAGVAKGSFYLHFASKEDAYLAVVEESLSRFLAKAEAVLRRQGSVPHRMRALVRVTAEHYGGDELLRASMFGGGGLVEGDPARRAAAVQRAGLRELLAEVIAAGQVEGTVRAELDPKATAAVLFEVGWAIVLRELDGTSDVPFETALGVLNDLVGLGLMTR